MKRKNEQIFSGSHATLYAVARLTWIHYLLHLAEFTRFSKGYTAKRAEEALKSIDNIQAVEANDFLFTRIQSRMETKKVADKNARIKLWYRLSAVLLVFVMLNATSYFVLKPVKSAPVIKHKTSGISAFFMFFMLNNN